MKISSQKPLTREPCLSPPNDDGGVMRDDRIAMIQESWASMAIDDLASSLRDRAEDHPPTDRKAMIRAAAILEIALEEAAASVVDRDINDIQDDVGMKKKSIDLDLPCKSDVIGGCVAVALAFITWSALCFCAGYWLALGGMK